MLPGTVIAERYRITRLLGEGGMGSVYEGEHVSVGRKFAIKFLHPNFARKANVVERFEREARAAGAIGHENIIDVVDFGQHDGAPFMVMEYLRGETLGARIASEGRLAIETTCVVMGQVLSALAAAHVSGIVHRDLKPDNVFLVQRGSQRDFVKLLDFGISKFSDKDVRSLTKSGVLMGTPFYMAPEQAMAKPDVDRRADLYSAGIMLYEMLTGAVPFNAASEAEVLMMICQRASEPQPASELNPAIPIELDAVIRRAMAYDREDRYQTAGELLEALRPFGGVGLVDTTDRSGSYRAVTAPTAVGTPTAWASTPAAETMFEAEAPAVRPSARRGRTSWLLAASGAALVVAGLATARAFHHVPASVIASPPVPSEVAVELNGIPDGAHVEVDRVATDARTLRFRPGSTHRLRVTAAGHLPFETTLVADRAEVVHIALADPVAADAIAPGPVAGHASTSPHPGHPHAGTATHHSSSHAAHPRGSLLAPTEEY